MTDFIIVGRGLAANTLAHTFYKHHLSFKIIGVPHLSNSSLIAAGIWNPVVFKRLTKSWMAHQTIPFLKKFYNDCEKILAVNFTEERYIIKPFSEEQEKKLWLSKARIDLDEFIEEEVFNHDDELQHCRTGKEFGKVKEAGSVNLVKFIEATEKFFKDHIVNEVFDHSVLRIEADKVIYRSVEAKNILFCEGHLVKNNPFFNWLPMKPVKGEILSLQCKDLKLKKAIFNKDGFIMNSGENIYKCGATYEWNELDEIPSQKGLSALKEKLGHLIDADYSIREHKAGIRPSAIDRRPLIGSHPVYGNVFVFNGMGTKGVMLAPFFANNFVLFYQQLQALNKEADVKRFYHLYNAHQKT